MINRLTLMNIADRLIYGGERISLHGMEKGHFVAPVIMEAKNEDKTVQEETFAPLLYLAACAGFRLKKLYIGFRSR